MLFEIIYQSNATKDFSVMELTELMIFSRKYNKENNITGCLVYHNRTFIQVLEGEKEEILSLYDRIKADDRHAQISTSWQGEIEVRGFEGWSMSLMNLSNKGLDTIFSDFLDTGKLSHNLEGIFTTSKSILMSMKDNL